MLLLFAVPHRKMQSIPIIELSPVESLQKITVAHGCVFIYHELTTTQD